MVPGLFCLWRIPHTYKGFGSAPGRIRTSDSRFRKPLLYPLSYRRIRLKYAEFSPPQTPVSAVRKQ
jgi:hypothetical protein